MEFLQPLGGVIGLVAYTLLIVALFRSNTEQSFAAFLLWALLDLIATITTILQHGNYWLALSNAIGSTVITLILIRKKQISWSWIETMTAFLVVVCLLTWYFAGEQAGIIASSLAVVIASIPQMVDTFRKPEATPTLVYTVFLIGNIVSLLGGNAWTIEERFYQCCSIFLCVVIVVFSLRKVSLSKVMLIPIVGSIVFAILYFIATLNYPGFSWLHNYWCNLLNENTLSGEHSTARPIAIVAMIILCLSLLVFWIVSPLQMMLKRTLRATIQLSGFFTMVAALFLFTTYDHDTITNLTSLFGLIATIGCMVGLYQKRWMSLFGFGLVNMSLVILNNILYYNKDLIAFLPVVQKITFLTFLLWVCSICLKANNYSKKVSPLH